LSEHGTARNAALSYQTQDIETADPVTLVARVFEIAARDAVGARAALAAGNARAKAMRIDRVSRCIGLLRGALNMEAGQEVSSNLDRLYDYLQRRLTEAHLRNDDAALEEIARHLAELHAAWREVAAAKPVAHAAEAASPEPTPVDASPR
jgi:flagellar protein FliS